MSYSYNRTAADSGPFSAGMFAIRSGLRTSFDAIRTMKGLIHYRLHGEGREDFHGKPLLTPDEERKTQALDKALDKIEKALKEAADESRQLEGLDPDKFTHYER